MEFKPLAHASWIMNAVVPINDHFRLSVSYNERDGMWAVGSVGSYEVAIQVGKPGSEYWSLVQMPDHSTNVYSGCDDAKIEHLRKQAETLKFGGEIEVFGVRQGAKERAWGHRFFCAEGDDQKGKLDYVARVFTGEDKWRFTPAT